MNFKSFKMTNRRLTRGSVIAIVAGIPSTQLEVINPGNGNEPWHCRYVATGQHVLLGNDVVMRLANNGPAKITRHTCHAPPHANRCDQAE